MHKPVWSPDEQFHLAVTGWSDEWWRQRGGRFEAVTVIGPEQRRSGTGARGRHIESTAAHIAGGVHATAEPAQTRRAQLDLLRKRILLVI